MSSYPHHMSGMDIYQNIKDDILSLRLKPGQMISENEVANLYGVSRTPIKTAFLRLKGEKYIEIIPQKGSFVTLLDMKYTQDIIYMHAVLEMDMIINIVKRGLTGKVTSILENNIDKQRKLIESKKLTPLVYNDIDSDFHFAFFQVNERKKMWAVIQDCQVYYTRFRILDIMTTARYKELYKEHQCILEALKAEDVPRIRKHIFDHLHENLRALATKIKGEYKDYFVQ